MKELKKLKQKGLAEFINQNKKSRLADRQLFHSKNLNKL